MVSALSIAGSDSGGGAGIQADLKTFEELDTFGMSVITAVTAQNTMGVFDIFPVSLENIQSQLNAVFTDIVPNTMKTGMLFSSEIVELVASEIKKHPQIPLICDCVMVAKGGEKLLEDDAIEKLKENLIPLSELITPNIPEVEILTSIRIKNDKDMIKAGFKILKMGVKNVLIKGGHLQDEFAYDVLITSDKIYRLSTPRVYTKNTHGTGCSYSAAICANLAQNGDLLKSVISAKAYIYEAIKNDLCLGHGHGPTNHFAYVKGGKNDSCVEILEL